MDARKAGEMRTGPDAQGGLSHEAIRAQLDRILASREFHATEKMRDFLRFVVEETLRGRKHRIKGYTIATQVFGRGEDFDPAHDPIVSIQARRLRRSLERYYLVAGGRDPIHIDIPKGRYIPRFTVQKFAERFQDSDASVTMVGDYFLAGPTLAVVPLEDLEGNPEQQFLTMGLTNELVTELNRFQDIVVIPCNHSANVAITAGSGAAQGEDPIARFMLRGAVRTDPASFRVSMQLTDAAGGRQLWAHAYTHPLEAGRLISTQEEIARRVVTAIASEYGIIARRLAAESRKKPPTELDTYEAMLRYYTHQIAPSAESGRECFVALERAAEREPDYGPVWSALATLHCQMYTFDEPGFDGPLETALRYAHRGVSLEPGSQLGRMILAYASYLAEDDDGFRQEAETSVALNPNSPYVVGSIGYFHAMRGEFDLGLPMLDRATAVNPYHPEWFHSGYVVSYLARNELEAALSELLQHRAAQSFFLPAAAAAILGRLGRTREAATHLRELEAQKPDFLPRAHEFFRRILKVDSIIDDLVDGLRTTSMVIEADE
jgi:adenylate cyclase